MAETIAVLRSTCAAAIGTRNAPVSNPTAPARHNSAVAMPVAKNKSGPVRTRHALHEMTRLAARAMLMRSSRHRMFWPLGLEVQPESSVAVRVVSTAYSLPKAAKHYLLEQFGTARPAARGQLMTVVAVTRKMRFSASSTARTPTPVLDERNLRDSVACEATWVHEPALEGRRSPRCCPGG